ncbi:MAG TPA: hypothetical protein VLF93_05290 [Candidatus Saccharimonadales bacterium]|nr:hypothetical protein [Candidatus Saccharimonadales bacterium]
MSVFRLLSFLLKEAYYAITYPFISLFLSDEVYRPANPKRTIVLVTCWFNKNLYHNHWATYLGHKGYQVYLVHLPFLNENFPTTVLRLKEYIARRKLKNYTLVGISTGALVCLYYLQFYKKWNTIHRFISLGGPLHGTITAWLIAFLGKGRDMVPGSSFIKEFEKYTFPKNKMVTISAWGDELVPPRYNKIKGIRSYIIPIWGHNLLHLRAQEPYDLIAKIAR